MRLPGWAAQMVGPGSSNTAISGPPGPSRGFCWPEPVLGGWAVPEEAGRRAAFVAVSGQRRELTPGSAVTFGRHEDCDLRIGVGDEWVSRQVGLVRMNTTGAVTVELTRSRHVLRVITPRQSERVLEPRPAGAVQEQLRLVWEHAILVVTGAGNAEYPVFVVTGEQPGGDAKQPDDELAASLTSTAHSRLSHDERMLLTALAEPLLRFGQVAEPASYAMVADRLRGRLESRTAKALTARMTRRYLDDLFDRLTMTEMVPGLEPHEGGDLTGEPEFLTSRVRRLAVWAVTYGVLTIADLDMLP